MTTMTITPQQVQKLREMTGAGILDCKKALESSGGDYDKAIQFLREKGKASAASKSGRAAGEGIVCAWISQDARKGSLVEINCETDFVAKTKEFQEFAVKAARQAAERSVKSAANLLQEKIGPDTLEALLKEKIGKLGENMVLRKAVSMDGQDSFVGSYVHAPYEMAECGKLGVLVQVQAEKNNAELLQLLKELCMQVAAASPKWISKDDVPADIIAKEKEIYKQQCKESGKPEQAWDKILDGKLKDFFRQFCLVEQNYVRDSSGKTPVQSLINSAAEKVGGKVSVKNFVRIRLGEE